MWKVIARVILRQRWLLLIIVGVMSIVMAYFGRNVELSYDLAQMLPLSDSTFIKYKEFKERFGEDGNVFNIIGLVSRALKRYKVPAAEVSKFQNAAFTSKSYDAVLRLCMEWVEVK